MRSGESQEGSESFQTKDVTLWPADEDLRVGSTFPDRLVQNPLKRTTTEDPYLLKRVSESQSFLRVKEEPPRVPLRDSTTILCLNV